MKIHWAAYIEHDHDGNDHHHESACGVGVTCKNCLKYLAKSKGQTE